MSQLVKVAFGFILAGLVCSVASAQEASITGTVRDTSGAVLPGVTVEASSPALIEKTRSVVTDGTGQYRIVGLRPGTYAVSFALEGFRAVKRDGVELTGSFTATVNAELNVGAVAETITVTGESPIVDVQGARRERVLSKEVLDTLPSSRNALSLAQLIPGATLPAAFAQDVGGTNSINTSTGGSIHGSAGVDWKTQIDGFGINAVLNPSQSGLQPNMRSAQEITMSVSGQGAEQVSGGMIVNLIPREGGNMFSGSLFATGANDRFQSNNFTQRLKDQGLTGVASVKNNYDVNPSFGGPLVRDRLWFFTSARWYGYENYAAGTFVNKNAGILNNYTYDPDFSQQAFNHAYNKDWNFRGTWQMNPKNKFNAYVDVASTCGCTFVGVSVPGASASAAATPEAAASNSYHPTYALSGTWSSPVTNRLFLEAGILRRRELWGGTLPIAPDDPARNFVAIVDSAYIYHGRTTIVNGAYTSDDQRYPQIRASLSYVSGAHAFKVGMNGLYARQTLDYQDNNLGLTYNFTKGLPTSLVERATPFVANQAGNETALYAQDRWTVKRMTLNLGIRYDAWHTYYPDHFFGPGPNAPTRNFTIPAGDYYDYHDLSPKLGVAYDLFGDGKTALKASLNRYVSVLSGLASTDGNPTNIIVASATRSWSDLTFPVGDPRRGNFLPDCDLTLTTANGECGALPANFGQKVTAATVADPNAITGWGHRYYNWEFSTGVQQQILPRASVDVGYFRRIFGNIPITYNRALTPADYQPYSVTAPVDPRLPNGGGYVVSGLYDLNPQKTVGGIPTDNYRTLSDTVGNQISHWNGVDVTVNSRVRNGLQLAGGFSTGRTSTDNCEIVAKVGNASANPSPLYCHNDTNFLTQVKMYGSYTISQFGGIQVAGTFQSLPGPNIIATVPYTSAQVAQTLGRGLSTATVVNVNVLEPGTVYGERLNQLDFRVGKVFRHGRSRTDVNFDLFNVFNVDTVLAQNNNYTGPWQTPQNIMQGRLAKFSVQFNF